MYTTINIYIYVYMCVFLGGLTYANNLNIEVNPMFDLTPCAYIYIECVHIIGL